MKYQTVMTALFALAAACSGESPLVTGPVCPTCQPELGGESGDLGGEITPCWGLVVREPVDVAQATALGFDVSELERRVARPVDMPLAWTASQTRGGGPATGYDPSTRVTASFSSRRTYQHVRPDPQYCDGTTCSFPGYVVSQASCARRLEVDVEAKLKTADEAVEATLRGTAWSTIPGTNGEADSFAELVIVETRTLLSEVRGTLRVTPDPGASAYRTSLTLQARLTSDAISGELSPNVMREGDELAYYAPLLGSFPAVTIDHNVDAGAPR